MKILVIISQHKMLIHECINQHLHFLDKKLFEIIQILMFVYQVLIVGNIAII